MVMFLPGEFLLQPALEREPDLMDWAMQNKVVIATPNTLMALLKTVEMGWREVRLARDAEEVGKLGRQIHERLQTWADHMVRMGNSLNQTVRHFNSGVGSLESRVLTSARRFKELGRRVEPGNPRNPDHRHPGKGIKQHSVPIGTTQPNRRTGRRSRLTPTPMV